MTNKRGGEDYSDTSSVFSLARDIITLVLIDFIKLGGSAMGACSPRKISISNSEMVPGGF